MSAFLLVFIMPVLLSVFTPERMKARFEGRMRLYAVLFVTYVAAVLTEVSWFLIADGMMRAKMLHEADIGLVAVPIGFAIYAIAPIVIARLYLQVGMENISSRRKALAMLLIYLFSSIIIFPFYRYNY